MSQKNINILIVINLLVYMAGCAALNSINPSEVTYTIYKSDTKMRVLPKTIKPKTIDDKLQNIDTDVRELHNKLLEMETKDKK